MLRIAPFALAALVTLSPLVSHAAPASTAACVPTVRDAWIRTAPMMPMGAGFFVLENRCKAAVALTGASSTAFGDVTMHETRVEGGVSRMRPLTRVDLASGASVEFKPGGRHLMLMSPMSPLTAGRRVRIDLVFADGRAVPVDFTVRSATAP